jgi:hypothetical protein
MPDGTIWFSDSSRVWPIEEWKNDLIEHTCTGRLLRRTPDGMVTTVVDRLCFANGVALTAEMDAVLVAETGTRTIRRVALGADGSPRATMTGPPGPPTTSPWQRRSGVGDHRRRRPIRPCASCTPKRTARVLALDSDGRTVHDLAFDATHWHLATGVREHDGRVWLGSLVEPAIAWSDALVDHS